MLVAASIGIGRLSRKSDLRVYLTLPELPHWIRSSTSNFILSVGFTEPRLFR